MSLMGQFLQLVAREVAEHGLEPASLARAVQELLPVDAVGISTTRSDLRLPLGATSGFAQAAEELQTSLGDGPCLAAARTRSTVVANLDEIRRRWPLFGEGLVERTPFRAVAALPLGTPGHGVFAAMDLYAANDRFTDGLDLEEISTNLLAPAGALLAVCLEPVEVSEGDPRRQRETGWFKRITARRRQVWVASGLVMGRAPQPTQEALSRLRAYAYSHDRSLDDVADDLVSGRLSVEDVL